MSQIPIVELFVFFATPFFAAWLERRRGFGWLDPVLTCYGVGLLLANLPLAVDQGATKSVADVVVPLAIPLLLFQTDFLRFLKTSRQTLIGFTVGVSAVLLSITTASWVFSGERDDLWMAAGMFTGTWTGGSPNLVSVGAALEVPEETLILTNAADLFVGGIYLFALLTFARPLLAKVMPEPEVSEPMAEQGEVDRPLGERATEAVWASLLAGAIVGLSAGAAHLLTGELSPPVVILGITTAGIAASFIPRVRKMEMSYEVGNYLILVFCVAIGALTDLARLLESGSVFLSFGALALAMTVGLHYTVCTLLKVDVDTSIITSVSTVMGPALVVPVAKRLDNRVAFVAGITSGLVGYALGNYLGVGMANLMRVWF